MLRQGTRNHAVRNGLISIFALFLTSCSALQLVADQRSFKTPLSEEDFKTPPQAAKPRVWWHWLDSNVTKDGITKDLEWMARVGIGGFQLFDVGVGAAQFVEDEVPFMSDEWLDALVHTAKEADRLGLEMAIHTGGGWSQSGGPWVKPEQAMKKYVWSLTRITGPVTTPIKLLDPPKVSGPYQDLAKTTMFIELFPLESARDPVRPKEGFRTTYDLPQLYKDQFVVAFPTGQGRKELSEASYNFKIDGELVEADLLSDGYYSNALTVPIKEAATSIEFEFDHPVSVSSATISFAGGFPDGELQYSSNGVDWERLSALSGDAHLFLNDSPVRTFSFAPATAKYYRVLLTPAPPLDLFTEMTSVSPPTDYHIAEIKWGLGKVNRFENKAGFGLLFDYDAAATPQQIENVESLKVVDITEYLRDDGSIEWDAPPGDWTILRIGYSLTGEINHPVTEHSIGLEVDKLNGDHVRNFLDAYWSPISQAMSDGHAVQGIDFLLIDSWEAGLANWTDGILEAFERRRGYSPVPFLPLLAGFVVDSPETSDRFLWDWRRTIADVLADDYNGEISAFGRENGLGIYAESMGVGLPTLGDGFAMKSKSTIPMGEFWYVETGDPDNKMEPTRKADIREAASVANIYGQNIVAAEAFTTMPDVSPWTQGPKDLKWSADYYAAEGVNRFVFASSVHQPLDDMKPGMSLWMFGQFLTRHDTWAEQSKVWFDYLSRVSFMLQQGWRKADIAIFVGEGAPTTVPFWKDVSTTVPGGYDFTYVDAYTIEKNLRVKDGELALPNGASFRVLVIPEDMSRLSLSLLRRLHCLVEDGAVLVSPPPPSSPSLTDKGMEEAYLEITSKLWGEAGNESGDYNKNVGANKVGSNNVGLGRVYWGAELGDILKAESVSPALHTEDAGDSADFKWTHRQSSDADIFFIANLGQEPLDFKPSFRNTDRVPELWFPEHGNMETVSFRRNDRVHVSLSLDPLESVFVVFRKLSKPSVNRSKRTATTQLAEISGAWDLSIVKDGVPDDPSSRQIETLVSWTQMEDAHIRDHSGTVVYTKKYNWSADESSNSERLLLDLGNVEQIAELTVNGRQVGIDWIAPYRFDVTGVFVPGENEIRVAVTNLWANKLMAEAKLPREETTAAAMFRPYAPIPGVPPLSIQREPLPSGLMGPVQLLTAEQR